MDNLKKKKKTTTSGLRKWQRREDGGGAAEVAVPHFLAQLAVEITRKDIYAGQRQPYPSNMPSPKGILPRRFILGLLT